MKYDYACELYLWLLHEFTSICGGMGLDVYIAHVSLWRGYEGGLTIWWTKWFMTKVVLKEWFLIWCYHVCALFLLIIEGVMTCWVCYA